MAGGRFGAALRDIQTLFDTGTANGLSDRELLERFVGERDASAQAAFEVLVLRHGPMVLRVCQNVLGDTTDAQDAFQATFLVLVKRSGSIRRFESLGSWLYGVASRVAMRARVEAARRRAAERQVALRVVKATDSRDGNEVDRVEFGPIIQEEIQRLPEKFRAVVVLCYWQGLTQEQAATQLGCPLGTVRSRLARARGKLHGRLTRRGLAPLAAGVVAALESPPATAARLASAPSNLITSTIKAGAQIAAGRAMTDVASASVSSLTQNFIRKLLMMKVKAVAAVLLLVGLGTFGVSLAVPQAGSEKAPPDSRSHPIAEKSRSKAQPALVILDNYVVEPPDLLLVEVLEALPGRPISGERLVRPNGQISLGFYGDVYVAGLTLPEVKEKIVRHLQKYLKAENLGLIGLVDDTGQPLIDPKTKKRKLVDPKDSDRVFVDVTLYNSKNYYIQGCVGLPGRLPVTGKETILDGINFAGGLTPEADHKRVVLYRQPSKGGPLQALPVDIDEITMGDDLSTNYQLLAGDRLVVPRLANFQPDGSEARAEHPKQEPKKRSSLWIYFDRSPTQFDTPPERSASEGDRSSESRTYLRRLETRLSDVEQKLDLIIDTLKAHKP